MNSEIKIIEQLKNFKKNPEAPINKEKFLQNLKIELKSHISEHPAILTRKTSGVSWYLKFSQFSLSNAVIIPHVLAMPQKTTAIILIACLFGISGMAIASQNSLPGQTLYPIKILSEEIQSSLALTPESKAIIHSGFTAERVMEVKEIMKQENINPVNLDLALINLQKNTSDATAIIDKESQKGTNVAELAKNINDALDENTESLKQIFKDKKDNLKKEESALKDEIIEAKKTNDQNLIASLNNKLAETKNTRKTLESSWNKNEETLRQNTLIIENQMEEKEKHLNKKNKAEKIIAEAKNDKQDLIDEILSTEPAFAAQNTFNDFDSALDQAEKAYAQEKYGDAETFAKNAIVKLNMIEKTIEDKNNSDIEEEQYQDKNKIQSQNNNFKKNKKIEENIKKEPNAEPSEDYNGKVINNMETGR